MEMNNADLAYFILPLVLWPVSFLLLQNIFIFALTGSTAILAIATLTRYKIRWVRTKRKELVVLAGVIGAILLYAFFVAGRAITTFLGLSAFVNSVYLSIYGSQGTGITTIVLIALIGVFEEIYWRGGLQGYVEKHSKNFHAYPWIASAVYYAFVHISTLNPILILAALVVGIVNGIAAHRFGVVSSAMIHVLWIEAIVVFFPV